MSSIKRCICMTCLTIAAVVAFSFMTYADDYSLGSAVWDDGENGAIYAIWDGAEAKTSYKVILCKEGHVYYDNNGKVKDRSGEKEIRESITKWQTVSGTKKDFAYEMSRYGAGNYYFLVLPSKLYTRETYPTDYVREHDIFYDDPVGYMVKSEPYILSSEDKTQLKRSVDSSIKAALQNARFTPGWTALTDGNWMYADSDGKRVVNDWVTDKGKKYYMDTSGVMVKGWYVIKGKYYYFGNDGALWVNTTTPDGYRVDGEGIWIENGKQVSSSEYKKYNKSTLALKIVEDPDSRGVIKSISIPDGKDYTVTEIRYSMDPSQWVVGNVITVYATVKANTGYSFENNMKITCSQGKLAKSTGDSMTRNLEIKYYPRIKLKTPDVVIDEDGMLRWNPVDRAKKYNVKIKDDEGNHTNTVTTTHFSLADYLRGSATDGIAVTVKVSAANGTNKYIQESDPFIINDLDDFLHNHSNEGRLMHSGLNTYYLEGDNDKVYGWVQHDGFWYYFNEKKNGRAIKNDWFQDPESGKWYYFDNDGHMLVNTTTPDGYKVGPDGACQ